MGYTIDHAGATTVSALLAEAGAAADDVKAMWLSYPTATFVKADRFGEELEVAEGTHTL